MDEEKKKQFEEKMKMLEGELTEKERSVVLKELNDLISTLNEDAEAYLQKMKTIETVQGDNEKADDLLKKIQN